METWAQAAHRLLQRLDRAAKAGKLGGQGCSAIERSGVSRVFFPSHDAPARDTDADSYRGIIHDDGEGLAHSVNARRVIAENDNRPALDRLRP